MSESLDAFIDFPELCFTGSITVPIQHHLMSLSNNLKDIKEIWSHPQALGQCKKWLNEHLNQVDTFPCSSTSKAALLASKNPHIGAICNIACAETHSLRVLAENIQDFSGNQTTFVYLTRSHRLNLKNGTVYVILLIAKNVSDLSHTLLHILGLDDFELVKIHSRPCPRFGSHVMAYFLHIKRRSSTPCADITECIELISDVNIRVLGCIE